MKKTLSLILGLALVSTFLFYAGCQKESVTSESSITPIFELALSEFNANKLPQHAGMLLQGSVTITKNKNEEIGIFVDENENKNSKLFYLITEGVDDNFKDKTISDATVLYLRKSVIVHSNKDSKNYIITLKNNSIEENSHLRNLKIDYMHKGYGLGMQNNSSLIQFREAPICLCKCFENGSSHECSSGGAGASQCSIAGECSVTCNSGYFACCYCV